MNLLEKELKSLIKKDDSIFNFIEENALDGLWYWDLENPKNGWHNAKFWKTLGYTSKEVKEQSITIEDVSSYEDVNRATKNFKNNLKSSEKNFFNENIRYIHKSGHTVWLNIKGTIIYKNNKPYRMLGTYTCITKQKEAELELKDRIQYYENVISGANMGSWECNLNTNTVKYNERWAEIFGYTLKELEPLTSVTWLRYLHPEDIEVADKAFAIHIKGEMFSECEFRMKHKEGHWVWILSRSKTMLQDLNGKPQIIAGSHYDITQRKTNELLAAHYKDLLERTNEVAKIGSWELDFKNNTSTWSKVTKQIYGVSNNYQPNLEKALAFYPEGKCRDLIQKVVNIAITEGKSYDVEVQILTAQKTLKGVRAIGVAEFKNNSCVRLYGLFQDIDTDKKNEIEIALSEKKFKNTFTSAGVGMLIININEIVEEVNQSFCNIFGYTQEEIKKINIKTLEYPEDANLDDHLIQELIEGKRESYTIEKRALHKSGRILWNSSSVSVLRNSDNELTGVIVQVVDITERKIHEQLLIENTDLLSRINEAAEIGIWEFDLIKNIVSWDSGIKKIKEVPEDYIPTLEDAISFYKEGNDREVIIQHAENAIKNGGSYDVDLQIITKNNNVKWIRTIGISEFKNGICTRLYGFIQNIDEKAKITQNLANKEEEQRLTFDNAAIGLAIIDANNVMQKANKSFCDILGFTEEELITLTFKDVTYLDDLAETNVLFSEMMNRERDEYKIHKRYVHKQGHVVWASVIVTSVISDQGELMHFLVQMKDITESKENKLLLQKNADLLTRVNKVAQIGTWEVDLVKGTVYWDLFIKKLMEVPEDYEPTLEDAIGFFKEGNSRDTIAKAVENAIENGENYDVDLEVVTVNKVEKWARTIGISEFENGTCTRLYGIFQDIDEKTRIAKNLAIKEEEQRLTFDNAAIGLAVLDTKGVVQKANKSFCDILGRKEKEVLTLSYSDITHPDDMAQTEVYFTELMEQKRNEYKIDKRYYHKNGHVIWVNVMLTSVKNDDGELVHFLSQMKDITKTKETELLLLKNADLMQRINLAARIGIWEVNLENNTVYWSDLIKQVVGVPEDYLPTLDEVYSFFLEGEHRENIINAIENGINKGKNFDFDAIITPLNTSSFWGRTIGVSEFENGECKRLYGFFQDIDEAKKMELEVALREEQFRQTFWYTNIGMTLLDLSGKVTRANPSVCKTFGYTEEEIRNTPIYERSHPEDYNITQQMMRELIEGKRDNFQIEKRYFHKNGSIVWVHLSTSAVKNDVGKTSHFVSQLQDITETKKLTESLKEHNNRLLNFAHIVSHNLRSHTGNISMLLDINQANNSDTIEDEIYQHIKSASDNMNETVQYLTEIVEISSQVKESLVSKNLNKSVIKALQNVQGLIDSHQVTVKNKVNKTLEALVVPAYLESIVLNLITNAIKYRSSDRLCEISIDAGVIKEFVYLQITDNGQGIDLDKNGDKLFGMYKTFHEHEDARGIGLFISKNQIEAMDGKIEVTSEVDKGSTFKTYFKYEHND